MTAPLIDNAHTQIGATTSTTRTALGPTTPAARRPARRVVHLSAVIVLIVGLVITMALSIGAATLRRSNEKRLLSQQVKQAALVLGGSVTSIEAQLSSSAEVAEATTGDVDAFKRFWDPIIDEGRPFQS